MNTKEPTTARNLFDQVVELPPEKRSAFLDENCADPQVRAQIEKLLAADRAIADDAFLQPPIDEKRTVAALLAEATAAMKNDLLLGQRIGRYHIKSLIGVGGMARVYEAVQEQPHRVVALKVMNPHAALRSALRRFQFESQVLGRLRHPNIAQIFEAGVAAPVGAGAVGELQYFAMEYLPGARPITQYAMEKHLDLSRRVQLLIQICDAVHHGHQRGVIHRDLKPANLLIDASGTPKVIDFGVARGTDSDIALTTQQTHLGELVGTMQYMSPEQCDGDPHEIDTRTDVYSLGIVLYELLAGSPPYSVADSTIYQATRIIKERFPEKPSAVHRIPPKGSRRLRSDLDTIALKALEKNRDRRFDSVAALADDLRRALACEPIQARRPNVWSHIARWIHRHPAAAMLTGSAFASTLILFGAYFVGWYWGRQPAQARISRHRDELQIIDRTGNLFTTFRGPKQDHTTFCFAEFLPPRGDPLIRRPFVVGVSSLAAPTFSAGLNVRDADNLFSPGFVLGVEHGHIPQVLRDREDAKSFNPAAFGAWKALLADIFQATDTPGEELVVAFMHTNTTQTMLAVYDYQWKLRYSAWLDAVITDLFWMVQSNQLVILGANGLYSLGERGLGYSDERVHPEVVFAIRPELDFIKPMYIHQEPGRQPDSGGPPTPLWYLMMPGKSQPVGSVLRRPGDRSGDDSVNVCLDFECRCDCRADKAHYGVTWTLDAEGKGGDNPAFSTSFEVLRSGERPDGEKCNIPGKDYWKLTDLPRYKGSNPREPGSKGP